MDIRVKVEKRYWQKTYAAFQENLQLIDGIHKTLKDISLPYSVGSSGLLEKNNLNLTKVDLLMFFSNDRIFSCCEINKWKPVPAIYLYEANQMGFLPKNCLVIEDSTQGVQAAISGGFDVLINGNEEKNKI